MYLDINDTTTLGEIQNSFANFYPYLQIRFFRKAHKKYEASSERDLVPTSTTIGELKTTHVSGVLEILPLSKAADVEAEFRTRFGLSVQVLRKEKNSWEQTTNMDDFTLKELNEIGRNSSDEVIMSDDEEDLEPPEA